MTRTILCPVLVVLLLALRGGPAVAVERVLPLGPAEVSELAGTAWVVRPSQPQAPLAKGQRLTETPRIETAAQARLELRFADGTLIRLGERTKLTLLPSERRVYLHQGRILVVGDRMAGGLAVLSELTALLPEGTSYLVEATPQPSGKALAALTVTVVEGAVCACPMAMADGVPSGAARAPDAMVLPGEQLTVVDKLRRPPVKTVRLAPIVASEPLWMGFASKLPPLRWVTENLDQQRRGILASRNARLRREIFWKRPPHPPVPPPTQFIEPAPPPTVRYEYPQ